MRASAARLESGSAVEYLWQSYRQGFTTTRPLDLRLCDELLRLGFVIEPLSSPTVHP